MFRNRQNSQKPPDELYAEFKASFPTLQGAATGNGGASSAAPSAQSATSLTDALDVAATTNRPYRDDHDIKDLDPTPRGTDQWRFTPSLLDPNSYAFSTFANQPPGYYTPTPGGTNTIYHNQAGDLHTPGFTLGLGTPLSMPTSEGPFNVAPVAHAPLQAFNVQGVAPHEFHHPSMFSYHHAAAQHIAHIDQHAQQQTFPPHQFTQQHDAYDAYDQGQVSKHPAGVVPQLQTQNPTPEVHTSQPSMADALRGGAAQLSLENFRYHVTLSAPTAMIRHTTEIPITYLNKGQAYAVTIIDTQPDQFPTARAQYRTFIRISFEDEQQRLRAAACWQLWKEGRGTNEAHHRGGRLQAVEFVDPASAGTLDSSPAKFELEFASFDGFAFTWLPAPGASAECSIAVRFNFLSTDFSHSKGVKGIPVRLCAKTELKPLQASPVEPTIGRSETCYCKVKLFRDHGAERKLANDIAHVKKSIDKLKQQIAQVEAGLKDSGKRKRSMSITKMSSKPGKVPKHKRTWSVSSENSLTGNHRSAQEDDLQNKLQALQDMFSSTRPASVLFLRGEELDDPDLHPVQLSMSAIDQLKPEHIEQTGWEQQPAHATIISPTPSSTSLPTIDRRTSEMSRLTYGPPSRMTSNEWQSLSQTATGDLQPMSTQLNSPTLAMKVPRRTSGLEGWIDAVGVDGSYQPPPERVIKPVACFYVQPRFRNAPSEDNFYRAVYLMQRTVKDLINGVAAKANVEPSKILQTTHVNNANLEILVDDGFVFEMAEGQDMIAEFTETRKASPGVVTAEAARGATEVLVDGDLSVTNNVRTCGYSLRLFY